MKFPKKFLKASAIHLGTFIILMIPVGMFLNFKTTGRLFNPKKFNNDWRCAHSTIDPIFGIKKNECKESSDTIGLVKEFPVKSQRSDILDILIIGGSVATELSTFIVFEKYLNKTLKENKNLSKTYKKVRVFNAANGGSKQPSGLFTYQGLRILGYKFDAVLEVSGFNEIALSIGENYNNDINPIYPRLASHQKLKSARIVNKSRLIYLLENIIWLHPLHQWLATQTQAYNVLEVYITDKKERYKSSKRFGMNYLTPIDEESAFKQSLNVWTSSASILYKLTNIDRVPYLLIMHPNQYLKDSKLLSQEEKEKWVTTDANEKQWYKWLGQPSFSMIIGNVISKYYALVKKDDFNMPNKNIVDLRYLFKSNKETLYKDQCCHFNKKGMDILATRISNEIFSLIGPD